MSDAPPPGLIQQIQTIYKIVKKSEVSKNHFFSKNSKLLTAKKNHLCFFILGLHDSTRALQSSPILRKKSRMRETKHLSTDVDSSTDTKKNPASKAKLIKNNFFLRCDFTPLMSKSIRIWDRFFALVFPKDSENLKCLDIGLREVGSKRRLNGVNKGKKSVKNLFHRGDFRPFWAKMFKSETRAEDL